MVGWGKRVPREWHVVLALLASLALALGIAACGGGESSSGGGGGGGGGGSAKPVTLTVGVIPIADVAPLYVGIQQGFFKQENLNVKPVLAEGGAAIVPAVLSGSDQIGFSNVTSLVIAASKGLPVQIVALGNHAGTGEKDAMDDIFVRKDSPIRSAKDLEGKTISVNNLNNVGPLTINYGLEQRGVDPKTVKYLEVPFPDAVSALKAKRVDAIWVVEPFRTLALAAGYRKLFAPFEAVGSKYTVATYFASKQYIAKNPDVVARFQRAINKSLTYSQANPDAVRSAVTTYTKIPRKAAQTMNLPQWDTSLDEGSIQKTIDLAARYGFIEKKPTLDELIYRGT